MAQYDGSIRINTQIETKQAEKELKSLESSIAKYANEIASLRSKMDALKDTKIPTHEYQKLQKGLSEAEKSLDGFYGKLTEIEKSKGFALDKEIKKAKAELQNMQKELFRLINIRDHLPSTFPELSPAKQAVADYEKQIDSLREKLEKQIATNVKIKNSAPYQKANANIEIYEQKVNELRTALEELKGLGISNMMMPNGNLQI